MKPQNKRHRQRLLRFKRAVRKANADPDMWHWSKKVTRVRTAQNTFWVFSGAGLSANDLRPLIGCDPTPDGDVLCKSGHSLCFPDDPSAWVDGLREAILNSSDTERFFWHIRDLWPDFARHLRAQSEGTTP